MRLLGRTVLLSFALGEVVAAELVLISLLAVAAAVMYLDRCY
jgi:hypothetical protein